MFLAQIYKEFYNSYVDNSYVSRKLLNLFCEYIWKKCHLWNQSYRKFIFKYKPGLLKRKAEWFKNNCVIFKK